MLPEKTVFVPERQTLSKQQHEDVLSHEEFYLSNVLENDSRANESNKALKF